MKKAIKKITTSVLAASMAAGMVGGAMPAFAAAQYTPVEGTSCNFNKYLIMDAGDNVPNVTFSFTVAPGAARSANTSDNTVMQVLPGVGTPTIADVTFAPSDATATAAGTNIDVARAASTRATGLTAANGVELESGEKYATKQATVDFDGITFDEPGIYRYIVTETASAADEAKGIMHDNDVDRVLDVYVTHSDEAQAGSAEKWSYGGTDYATQAEAEEAAAQAGGQPSDVVHTPAVAAQPGLVVSGYVLHTDDDDVVINNTMGSADVAAQAAALDDKTDGFTNEYNTKDIRISKEVAGNQASRDKWFELTATLSNVNDDDVFTVSIADDNDANTNDGSADATSGTTAATRAANQSKTNPTTVTGAQLKAGQKFYLQHGQNVVIRGLAPNATYAITEDAEDYQSAVKSGATNSGTISEVAGQDKVIEAGFRNTRDGIIPTGVALAILPGVALAGLGGFGVLSSMRKRKDEE